MGRGIHLGKIGGVDVHLDWSLLIIFLLITAGLGSGLFPQWHPEWSAFSIWITAMLAAVSLIAAILIHELSHAWVGRAQGVEINRITLFVFGGVAQMESEPRRWQAELWMAIVGPITSAVIGIVCIWLGYLTAGDFNLAAGNLEEAMSGLGPLPTLLFWLGPVNIILALFNLVPGFPLDGGRVLRAALWGATGDLSRATRWASNAGRAFGGLLILSGIAMILGYTVPVFGTGLVNGLWIALIGWFLHNAAMMGFRQQAARESLTDVTVEDLMQTRIASVPADLSVARLIDEYLMKSDQRSFPVVDGERFAGLVCLDDIRAVERARWDEVRVADVMKPASDLKTLKPRDPAIEAMSLLNQGRFNQIPIVDERGGRVLGLLTREGVLTWLSVYGRDAKEA